MIFRAAPYWIVVAIALFFIPLPSFAAGCDVQSDTQDPTHIRVFGACATSADAQQACIGYANGLGYTDPNWCHFGGSVAVWEAGWLCSPPQEPGTCPLPSVFYLLDFYPFNYFASAHVDPRAVCGQTCNSVGHPINPASGTVFDMDVDIPLQDDDAIAFKRFYNSMDSNDNDLSTGWRHSFSRSIKPKSSSVTYQPYQQGNLDFSSSYTDASIACTAGFTEIKAHVTNWQGATASYSNGICKLSLGGVVIGTLPILAFQPQPFSQQVSSVLNALAGLTTIGFDVTRDDGQLINFTLNGSSIVAPPGINMTLQQTSSGYTLTDANDTVEAYDINGRLLSVTSRAGVVQTMSYDASGWLSGVSDTFGHQLTLSYDSQNRLTTVTRQ